VAAGHFVVDFTGQIPTMMFPILLTTLDLTYTDVGFAAGLYTLVNALSQPFFGYLSDRFGARFIAAAGVLFQAVFIGLAALSRDYTSLLLFLSVAGLFSGGFHPVAVGVASRVGGGAKGTAVGTFFIGGNLGFAISPLIAARMFDLIGLTYAMFLSVPAAMAAAALVISVPRGRNPAFGRPGPWSRAQDAVSLRTLAAVVTVMFFRSYVYTGLSVFIPLLYRAEGLTQQAAGVALSLFLAGFASGSFLGGYLIDRIGRKLIIVTSLALATPLALPLIAGPGGPLTLFSICSTGFMIGCSFTPTIVIVQDQIPRLVGAASGLALGFTFASGAVGQMVTGRLADGFGLDTAMTVIALAPMAALVGALLMGGPFRPRPPARLPAA